MDQNIHLFTTPEVAANAVAEVILSIAKLKNKQSIPFNIAISGGNTPKLLFSILANEYANKIPWNIVRLFWVDERCVPPTHPDSNFGMTYENLLTQVSIQEVNIFRILGEAEPQKEAKRYEILLEFQLPQKKGIPVFDLVLLGMGDEGHTASIFPDNLALLHSDSIVAVATHPINNQQRITLTGNVINAAENVLFLIAGATKATVLGQIINKKSGFENYPASYIHSQNGTAEFYLDRAAANQINE